MLASYVHLVIAVYYYLFIVVLSHYNELGERERSGRVYEVEMEEGVGRGKSDTGSGGRYEAVPTQPLAYAVKDPQS